MEGKTVSHYRILEKFGEGGMEKSTSPRMPSLEVRISLKSLLEFLEHDETALKRLVSDFARSHHR